jgi:hypothetical protein
MKGRLVFINLASIVSILALLVCIITPVLVFSHTIEKDAYHVWFNWASLAWFLFAPFWFVPGIFGPGWNEAGNQAWLRPKGR